MNLALQGGGSHGAFTWGVLDAFLEQAGLVPDAISGTSAGALNALALASGWASALAAGRDPREAARASLRAMWDEVVALGAYSLWTRHASRGFIGARALAAWSAVLPVNPLGINPLRAVLQRRIDFDALRAVGTPRVHVSATHVRSGRAAIFSGPTLGLEAALASACLPQLFPPVEIDGEAYWDGGYSVNPPLAPFQRGDGSADVLLVQINAVTRPTTPSSVAEIAARESELTYNAGLLSQIRAVRHVNELIEAGVLRTPGVRQVRLHAIDGGAVMQDYPQSTRGDVDAGLVREWFERGRASFSRWMDENGRDIGRRSTVRWEDYADDTWLQLLPGSQPAGAPVGNVATGSE